MGTILVGGDAATTLDPADSLLERGAWEVGPTTTREDLLQAARSLAPQLVVLDPNDPRIDASVCCRELKGGTGTSSIPVVLVVTPTEQARWADAGADGF